MRIYIIQDMRSKTKEEVTEERQTLVDYYKGKGCTVVDSYYPTITDDVVFEDLFVESWIMANMSKSDLIVYMSGWDKSPRCQTEDGIAVKYGMARYFPKWA